MSLYEWSEDYSTHIRAIDSDHKNLFDTINTLHDAQVAGTVVERISPILGMLHTYVVEHFTREERFLEQAGYPELDTHRAAHRKFTCIILNLETLCQREFDRIDIDKVLAFLGTWLQDHILVADMKYVSCLRGENNGAPPSDLGADDASDMVQLSISVPHDKVDLVKRIVHTLGSGTSGERFEQSLKTALDKIEAAQLDHARKLFAKSP